MRPFRNRLPWTILASRDGWSIAWLITTVTWLGGSAYDSVTIVLDPFFDHRSIGYLRSFSTR
jgi:hypothetical protein